MDFAADLPFFYDEFSVLARHTPRGGGASTDARVLFDQPGIGLVNGEVQAVDLGIRYPASAFPAVRKDDVFIIGGKTYLAREAPVLTEDGAEYTVSLKRSG